MATEETHVNLLQKGEIQERMGLSLDKLEQKYEEALQEWEKISVSLYLLRSRVYMMIILDYRIKRQITE